MARGARGPVGEPPPNRHFYCVSNSEGPPATPQPTVTRCAYLGSEDNLRLANGEVELMLPTGYGPRVMRYAPIGGENVFGEVSPAQQGQPTPFGDTWHIRGGHRLWTAPEDAVGSYHPDNTPVVAEVIAAQVGDTSHVRVVLMQPPESHTGLEKAMEITLSARGSQVSVLHRLTHRGQTPIELAPWALSVMARGGTAIFPHPPFVPHPEALAPANPLVLWPFTRMNDTRWRWGDRYFFLRQNPALAAAQKVGFYNPLGWMAYQLDHTLFVKRHTPLPGPHADQGCNAETFTNDAFLELETLGPIRRLAPGEVVTHREDWFLFPGVKLDLDDEGRLTETLRPLLDTTRAARS